MSAAKQLLDAGAEMPERGHNNPPAEIAFSMEIDELFALVASAGPVKDERADTIMDGLLDDFRKARKATDEARKKEKAPHDAAAKRVQDRFNPVLAKADRGMEEVKALLTPYRARVKAEKDAAAAKAREDADALQRAAQVKLQSDDLEVKFAAEQELKDASKLSAAANRMDRAPKGTRAVWSAEITDRKAALLFLLPKFPELFVDVIQRLANTEARGARSQIPGIVYSSAEVAN